MFLQTAGFPFMSRLENAASQAAQAGLDPSQMSHKRFRDNTASCICYIHIVYNLYA